MVSLPRLYPYAENRILYADDSTEPIDVRRLQLCFHTMSGYLMGSEAQWKTNGAQGVRSHFGVGGAKDAKADNGRLVQWNSLQRVAYAQNNGNPYCISVETSDGAVEGLPWSENQIDKIVGLIVWFSKLCGRSEPKLASSPGEFGTITYHQQFSTFNIHNHDCPGSVRRGQLLNYAMPRAKAAMTVSTPTIGGIDMGGIVIVESSGEAPNILVPGYAPGVGNSTVVNGFKKINQGQPVNAAERSAVLQWWTDHTNIVDAGVQKWATERHDGTEDNPAATLREVLNGFPELVAAVDMIKQLVESLAANPTPEPTNGA